MAIWPSSGTKATLVRYSTPDGQPPGSLDTGGLMEFSEVEGMCRDDWKTDANPTGSLNGVGPVRMSGKKGDPKFTFRINLDSEGGPVPISGLTARTGGGVITEKKEAKPVAFKPLGECATGAGMLGDGFVMSDCSFSMSELQLHVANNAVFEFQAKHQRRPGINSAEDAAEVLTLARAFEGTSKVLEGAGGIPIDEKIIRLVAMHSAIELQPICAFFGGIVAQELVKVSGKFTPITQYFNYHGFQAYPDTTPTDTAPLNCRYDDFIAVYGKAFQEMLGNLKIFMVGCGALGCEYVKNFALLGVCCGPTGKLTITDNDTIEVSNLNRQFLFRSENVGQPKSTAATGRATSMNPAIKIDAKQDLVASTTEHIFHDDFWSEQDLICNALDNMQARFYVDGRCVFFEKPLLESGTMGTGANVDVVIPHLTLSYADGGQADEGGGVPMCTLRNFPHLIDHCIEWARAQFEDLFVTPAQAAEKFLQDPAAYIKKVRAETLELPEAGRRATAVANALAALPLLRKTIETSQKPTIEDCVAMAFEVFHASFRDKILDLTNTYPADSTTKSGDPFWSGHKKFPTASTYDPANETHVSFMVATSNLFACMLKVHGPKGPVNTNDPGSRWMAQFREPTWLATVLRKVKLPEYQKGSVSLEGDDSGATEDGDDAEAVARLEEMLVGLAGLAGQTGAGLEPADFEKDDDDNFHIDFIAACSNLRATNYSIPNAPRHKCKMIAGRIIPAIATTTASVTGLVMMEMMKLLQRKPIEQFRNGNYNIGTNEFFLFEANPPPTIKDSVVINAPDPKDFPDAYDAKGKLQDMYKDPEMGLGFAEWARVYPNPHTKYDKYWVDNTRAMTVEQLRDACDALFKDAGLTVSAISCPSVQVECDKDADHPAGVKDQARAMWNSMMPSTKANLSRGWVELLKELTTRSDTNPIVSDPIDVSVRKIYNGITFLFENGDGDDVSAAPVVLKLDDFKFTSYKDSPVPSTAPWL